MERRTESVALSVTETATCEGEQGSPTIEMLFEGMEVPSWREQITVRALVVSLMLGIFFSFVVMNLNLSTGIIPSLNLAAGLLGYFMIHAWTKVADKFGLIKHPFTRQENTVIQTCVVAISGVAFSGICSHSYFAFSFHITLRVGFATYIASRFSSLDVHQSPVQGRK